MAVAKLAPDVTYGSVVVFFAQQLLFSERLNPLAGY
jgi:hypothetical protein